MLARKELLRIARRYDTVMSLAMMRALGYAEMPRHHRRRKHGGGVRRATERATYADLRWCFANHGSPMDLQHAR